MPEVLLRWESMRRMACAVTVRGMDAGNSTQDLQLEPGRRPEQSSLNITHLWTKLDKKLEYYMKLGLEVLDLIDPYGRHQVYTWKM